MILALHGPRGYKWPTNYLFCCHLHVVLAWEKIQSGPAQVGSSDARVWKGGCLGWLEQVGSNCSALCTCSARIPTKLGSGGGGGVRLS